MACQNKEKGYDIDILATDSPTAALKPHTNMKVLAWESCVGTDMCHTISLSI